jgi:polysaccharide biosynthesis transport protein
LFESYLVKYREASARDSINAVPPEARIISRATPALKPAYPKKPAIVLIAAFAAFGLSAGFTVIGALLASPPPAYAYGYMPVAPLPPAVSIEPAPQIVSPPLAPMGAINVPPGPLIVGTIEQLAHALPQAGEAGRRVTVVGTARNVGTTFAAITLARALAQAANVVLVDLAFGSPNLSVISTDAQAPGIAELVRGTASVGEIITRDQYSRVHLVATGNVGNDGASMLTSPALAMAIEALGHNYQHVVIDAGSVADVSADHFGPLTTRVMLVAADPASAVTRAVRGQLLLAGFSDVAVVAGGAQAAAA